MINNKLQNILLLFAISLFIAACGSTKIFHVSFDSDAIGSLPNENPPGLPVSDRIYFSGGGTATPTSQLSVVNTPPFSTRRLRYTNVNVPIYNRYVGFISKEATIVPDKTYYAYWNGVIDLAPTGSGFQV